jgi:hypothetical protein
LSSAEDIRLFSDKRKEWIGQQPPYLDRSAITAADEPIVQSVTPDPEPHDVLFAFHSQCPVVQAGPNRPESSDFLEVQRWVFRVLSSNW